jgi:hypothetical protein
MNHLQVYGFPRSGNHYLIELLALNFYRGIDLQGTDGEVGHWADRQRVKGSRYGKLAGHHGPPEDESGRATFDPTTAVYIYRDGRAVAASLYKSPHFKNPQWQGQSFSEFIRKPLDWAWSPGARANRGLNVIEHWREHLDLWRSCWWVYKVQYELAVEDPAGTLDSIAARFDLGPRTSYNLPELGELVGWFPSGGVLTGWRSLWSADDLDYFWSIVKPDFYGVFDYDRDRAGVRHAG